MARPPFPKSLRQFQVEFATEEACQKYLAALSVGPTGSFVLSVGIGRPTFSSRNYGGSARRVDTRSR